MAGKTLFEKIWDNHVVVARDDGKTLLYVDRQLCPIGNTARMTRLWRKAARFENRNKISRCRITAYRRRSRKWRKLPKM